MTVLMRGCMTMCRIKFLWTVRVILLYFITTCKIIREGLIFSVNNIPSYVAIMLIP